ncbi:phospholipase D-like domain-containing protein [Bradyrhizobium sp. UFLA01-814]|uniref:phospholipase D-like domain-containing protein n=1 Tax=Bradyrhizobium sp. UFLA01-814 TaxID=3023480 RepID=UPI00398AC974
MASILDHRSQLALRCFAQQSGMLHEKSIIVDGTVVWVGSANLTWRGIKQALEALHASAKLKNGAEQRPSLRRSLESIRASEHRRYSDAAPSSDSDEFITTSWLAISPVRVRRKQGQIV